MKSYVVVAMGFCVLVAAAALPSARAQLPGAGPHKYAKYPGTATIVRVEKSKDNNHGKAAEGYNVWFTFVPKEQVKEENGQEYLKNHKEHEFTLTNGWHPGPKYLKKYGIKQGAKMPCTLSVIIQGTTSPIIFELDGVDRADYFEAAPR